METIFNTSQFVGNSIFLMALRNGIAYGRIDVAVDMVVSQTIDNRRLVIEIVGIDNVERCLKYWINKRLQFHEIKNPANGY